MTDSQQAEHMPSEERLRGPVTDPSSIPEHSGEFAQSDDDDFSWLEGPLAELEATDPAVRAAADRLAAVLTGGRRCAGCDEPSETAPLCLDCASIAVKRLVVNR